MAKATERTTSTAKLPEPAFFVQRSDAWRDTRVYSTDDFLTNAESWLKSLLSFASAERAALAGASPLASETAAAAALDAGVALRPLDGDAPRDRVRPRPGDDAARPGDAERFGGV